MLGWGNPSRGDDALGLAVSRRLEQARDNHPDWPELHVVAAHQLQVEHILDLQDCDLALFVDASINLPESYAFRSLEICASPTCNTHALDPGELLQLYERSLCVSPPCAFLLGIGGTDFGFGHPLSDAAQKNLTGAMELVEWALAHPTAAAWLAQETKPIW